MPPVAAVKPLNAPSVPVVSLVANTIRFPFAGLVAKPIDRDSPQVAPLLVSLVDDTNVGPLATGTETIGIGMMNALCELASINDAMAHASIIPLIRCRIAFILVT